MPLIPPRPARGRIDRSISPGRDRFAPSPLNDAGPFLSNNPPRSSRLSVSYDGEALERSTSVDLPSIGQEGMEYAGLAKELGSSRSNSPEQTRTVGDDVKLHAPKPSLPASSAKQRVMTVTRTDSDKAASFGIGKPSSTDGISGPPYGSIKKKGSTTSQLSNGDTQIDEEHGIPEIGRQVPMYPNAGDVQAPSPAPGSENGSRTHHVRKASARGSLPPGSYGLHGHGVVSQDRLEKAYYDKHPDLRMKEHTPHHHDRPNDFSMSRDELNQIVRDTARSTGMGRSLPPLTDAEVLYCSGLPTREFLVLTSPCTDIRYAGTPSEQLGWQAMDESTSRVASPMPASVDAKSPLKPAFKRDSPELDNGVIHVDEPGSRRKSVLFNDDAAAAGGNDDEAGYSAPILAEDEVQKNPPAYEQPPAVELPLERRGSVGDEPVSRPTSRPASLYKEMSFEHQSTPLEDVEEYEPLFPEDEKAAAAVKKLKAEEQKQRFPSRDIWEDAPNSVHYTAEVSTPNIAEDTADRPTPVGVISTQRTGESPAQAFARQQEELAEREARQRGPDGFVRSGLNPKTLWVHPQHRPREYVAPRPSIVQRFPSRDVWEDTPDSLKLETTVSSAQSEAESPQVEKKQATIPQPQQPPAPADESSSSASDKAKPMVPERPKPKHTLSDEGKPAIPGRPKPQIPARPVKAGPTSAGLEPAEAAAPPRAKPAVPARPMGSKIAALQAGFMSDLNNRLRLGPQAPKKEEPAEEEAPAEEKEKVPLSDARKSRARGPQRRAPAKSPSPAAAAAAEDTKEAPKFAFSIPSIVFEIDPDEGSVSVGHNTVSSPPEPAVAEEEKAEATAPSEGTVPSELAVPAPAEETEVPAADKPEEEEEEEEEKPLTTAATNLAGEPVVEVGLEKGEHGDEVEPTAVEEH